MNILTRFQGTLEKKLKEHLGDYIYNTVSAFNNPYDIDSYKQFAEAFDQFTANFTIQAYEEFILALDEEFMQSNTRKQLYGSKGYLTKPLLTKFGWINFKRRKYIRNDNGKSFMFIDRLLGLEKYSRLDPFVITDLCEEAASTSYANAGRLVSKTIGNKIKYNDDINKNILSRATARNIVLKASKIIKEPDNEEIKEIAQLNLLLDEKYVPSQFNDGKDHMIKAAVIYESYKKEYKGRIRLAGKKVFGTTDGNILPIIMDYIYYHYDTDKLKYINIMGDGALWIRAIAKDTSLKFHKDIKIRFGLDHFHLAQAIQIITTNKYKELHGKFILRYIIQNNKLYFIEVCEILRVKNLQREDKIKEKMEYILNNWEAIQTSFHQIKWGCCMESNISHIFADLFTARPKAYSKKGLDALLKIRLLKANGYDFKELYFASLKLLQTETKEKIISEKHIIGNIKFNDSLYASVPEMHSSDNNGLSLRNIINSGIKI